MKRSAADVEYIINKASKWCYLKPLASHIGAEEAQDFKTILKTAVGDGEKHLLLDMAEVSLIDSTGLGTFVSAVRLLKPGSEFVICNPRHTLSQILDMTRLNRIMRIFGTLQEAEEALSQT
jgi:anti-sigma B factor antagonist